MCDFRLWAWSAGWMGDGVCFASPSDYRDLTVSDHETFGVCHDAPHVVVFRDDDEAFVDLRREGRALDIYSAVPPPQQERMRRFIKTLEFNTLVEHLHDEIKALTWGLVRNKDARKFSRPKPAVIPFVRAWLSRLDQGGRDALFQEGVYRFLRGVGDFTGTPTISSISHSICALIVGHAANEAVKESLRRTDPHPPELFPTFPSVSPDPLIVVHHLQPPGSISRRRREKIQAVLGLEKYQRLTVEDYRQFVLGFLVGMP